MREESVSMRAFFVIEIKFRPDIMNVKLMKRGKTMEKNFNNDNAQTETVAFDKMKPYMKENMLNELGEEKYAEIKPDEKFLHITSYDDLKEFLAQLDGQDRHVMTQPVEVNAGTATAQLKRRLEKLLDK